MKDGKGRRSRRRRRNEEETQRAENLKILNVENTGKYFTKNKINKINISFFFTKLFNTDICLLVS